MILSPSPGVDARQGLNPSKPVRRKKGEKEGQKERRKEGRKEGEIGVENM